MSAHSQLPKNDQVALNPVKSAKGGVVGNAMGKAVVGTFRPPCRESGSLLAVRITGPLEFDVFSIS